eukprot:13825561-Ditylum_brightwellii.AAC.1
MDYISIASSSISNTCTLNVLPFNAGIPATAGRIAVANETGNSNSSGCSSKLTRLSSGHSSRLIRLSFCGQGGIGMRLHQQSSANVIQQCSSIKPLHRSAMARQSLKFAEPVECFTKQDKISINGNVDYKGNENVDNCGGGVNM